MMLLGWCFQNDGYGSITEDKKKGFEAKTSFC